MVGRLIQNQQIDRFQQKLDHRQPGTFSTGKHLDFLHGFFRSSEHESSQQIADLVADFSLRHIIDGLEYGQILVKKGSLVLGKITDLYIMSQCQCTFVIYLIHDTFHQSRLTLSVFTHKSNLISPFDRQIGIPEHDVVTI